MNSQSSGATGFDDGMQARMKARAGLRAPGLALGIGLIAAGCATQPVKQGQDPRAVLTEACKPGRSVLRVKGSVWIKAQSKEAKGQFPAVVDAGPDRLRMEAVNLTGGTEAVIVVDQGRYSIEMAGKKGAAGRKMEGNQSWGGIPLRWATELFLGRIPCPAEAARAAAKATIEEGDRLVVETPDEKFVYNLKGWAGGSLATELHWERTQEPKVAVDFKFSDPEDKTYSPRKWEAKSASGEVKVRWKDREVTSAAAGASQ